MSRADPDDAEERAIASVVDALEEAVRAKDVDAFLYNCARNVTVFDLVPPLMHEGADAVRGSWDLALTRFEGRVDYAIGRRVLMHGGDVAVVHGLCRFGGTTRADERVHEHLRVTLALRKADGHWKLTHLHASVPIDRRSGRALIDLDR